jgi:hypothetical protein
MVELPGRPLGAEARKSTNQRCPTRPENQKSAWLLALSAPVQAKFGVEEVSRLR